MRVDINKMCLCHLLLKTFTNYQYRIPIWATYWNVYEVVDTSTSRNEYKLLYLKSKLKCVYFATLLISLLLLAGRPAQFTFRLPNVFQSVKSTHSQAFTFFWITWYTWFHYWLHCGGPGDNVTLVLFHCSIHWFYLDLDFLNIHSDSRSR